MGQIARGIDSLGLEIDGWIARGIDEKWREIDGIDSQRNRQVRERNRWERQLEEQIGKGEKQIGQISRGIDRIGREINGIDS